MVAAREEDILERLTRGTANCMLDLGCGDGVRTSQYAGAASPLLVVGVERSWDRACLALARGVQVVLADLNSGLPFRGDCFNLIISNQVIEHLERTESFVKEIVRIGENGSQVVISTENLRAWENIGARLLGYESFSFNVIGRRKRNPFSLNTSTGELDSHARVFTLGSLRLLLTREGIRVERMLGSGIVFVFHKDLMRLVARLDPSHCRFVTAVCSLKKEK